jgi:non-heme chloroperoxidase
MTELFTLTTRRDVLAASAGVATLAMFGMPDSASAATNSPISGATMDSIKTKDGVSIFYKDLGPKSAQAIVFHHGWPLSADDWDAQMMFFLLKGFRVIAHDRRGHGRSTQTFDGNEMDTYAADVARSPTRSISGRGPLGHSTGGGEVALTCARAKPGRVSKAVLIGAVPPIMVKKESNPGGLPIEVFDGLRAALSRNRRNSFSICRLGRSTASIVRERRSSRESSENWWRQGMMGGAKAHYDCIKAFSETDFTEDLKKIDVPTLVMHGPTTRSCRSPTRRRCRRSS